MSQNLILQFCYMTQLSLQRNKTVLKDPVMFFYYVFILNGNDDIIDAKVDLVIFLHCSGKTV